MSDATHSIVMARIKTARPDSMIAVFRSTAPGLLSAVFDSTVQTRALIAANDQGYLGSFHGKVSTHELGEISRYLLECIQEESDSE